MFIIKLKVYYYKNRLFQFSAYVYTFNMINALIPIKI